MGHGLLFLPACGPNDRPREIFRGMVLNLAEIPWLARTMPCAPRGGRIAMEVASSGASESGTQECLIVAGPRRGDAALPGGMRSPGPKGQGRARPEAGTRVRGDAGAASPQSGWSFPQLPCHHRGGVFAERRPGAPGVHVTCVQRLSPLGAGECARARGHERARDIPRACEDGGEPDGDEAPRRLGCEGGPRGPWRRARACLLCQG